MKKYIRKFEDVPETKIHYSILKHSDWTLHHGMHRFNPSQSVRLRSSCTKRSVLRCYQCSPLWPRISFLIVRHTFIVSAKDHLQTALLIHGNIQFLHLQQLEQTRMQCSRTAGCGEAVSNLHNPQLDAASSGLSLSKPLWKMWEQIKLGYTAYIYICM